MDLLDLANFFYKYFAGNGYFVTKIVLTYLL